MVHRANIAATLRQAVAKIDGTQTRLAVENSRRRLSLGIEEIDNLLGGGIVCGDMHEVRCSLSRDLGCASGFLLGLLSGLEENKRIVWITDPATAPDCGKLFPDGLVHFKFDASRLIQIQPLHLNDFLWAAGEAAKTSGLAAVVLHTRGNPVGFDLSISRKLMLRAQTSKTPLFVLRQAGEEEASSAATRWHIAPATSLPDTAYHRGLGAMRQRLTLEKHRNGQTGNWTIYWNTNTRSFEHAASRASPTHSELSLHPSANRSDSPPALGQVLAVKWKQRQAS